VAGISIGIIQDKDNYQLLTDIQGLEDHYGGMDLKIAGTIDGITAIQMDVKILGINEEMFIQSLARAYDARVKILDKMKLVIDGPRKELSKYAPRVIAFQINPDKIGEVIGPGGKTINQITDDTGAKIDVDDSGSVFVTAEDEEAAIKAVNWIKNIVREVEVGEIFQGEVKRILDFGAFVEILPGQEGLVHISKISNNRVEKVGDVLKLGDIVSVKVIGIDDQGRINLSIKDV
jgi:polyribonucleotide nucleotidyltransferase